MIHQRTKDLIFYFTYYFTKILRPFYVAKFAGRKDLKVHLGSGQNIIKDFINIDGNPLRRSILYYDIRNKLPFPNNSIRYIFTSNVLEHFYPDEVYPILNNINRVLDKDGILRIVVPDLAKAISAYTNNDFEFFRDFPRAHTSLGGRFSNHILCDAQHKIIYDFSYLKELLESSGFVASNIKEMKFGSSNLPPEIYKLVEPFEKHFTNTDLFVEAQK